MLGMVSQIDESWFSVSNLGYKITIAGSVGSYNLLECGVVKSSFIDMKI